MPIRKVWSVFEEERIEGVPDTFGVYELGNRLRNVIYIGHGKLQSRPWDHYDTENPCIRKAYWFRCEKTGSKLRAEQRERSLLNRYYDDYGRLPECNRRFG